MSAVLFSTWYGSCHLLHALVSSWFDYSNALCVAFKDRNFSFSHVTIHYKAVASLKSIASTLQALHWLQGTSFVQALSDLGLDPLRKCLLLCKSLLLKTMIWCCGYLQTRINATILYIIGIKSWDTLGLSPGPSGCNGICFWVDMLRIVLQGCNPNQYRPAYCTWHIFLWRCGEEGVCLCIGLTPGVVQKWVHFALDALRGERQRTNLKKQINLQHPQPSTGLVPNWIRIGA